MSDESIDHDDHVKPKQGVSWNPDNFIQEHSNDDDEPYTGEYRESQRFSVVDRPRPSRRFSTANRQSQRISVFDPGFQRRSVSPSLIGEAVPFHRTEHPPPTQLNPCLAIFASRQIASKGDREVYIKYSVRELIIYTLYLATFCTMVFVNHSAANYYYTKVIRDLLVDKAVTRESDVDADSSRTFLTSSDVRDFWNYVEGPMLEGLFWENFYGAAGADRTNIKNLYVQELVTAEEKKYGILYENQLMGLPRLRQLRVVPAECPVADNFRQLLRQCYPEYSFDNEDAGDENNRWSDFPSLNVTSAEEIAEAWTFRTGSVGSWHWGHLAWYSSNGAVRNLERTYASSKQRMKQLKQHLWITRATRVVLLDFTVYNANINLFCVVKLVWEFPPTGGVLTSHTLRTVKLIRYKTSLDLYVVLPAEILFMVFTLYYLIQELIEMCYIGCPAYILDLWSWLDVTILITSLVCIGFSVYRYRLVEDTLGLLTLDTDEFYEFEFLGYWETQFNHAISLCLFFSWVKVFKYISFNKTMTQLSSTLSRCATDVGGFAIMFFIVFFAFAQLGYLLFGSQIEDFSTFINASFTLLRMILGDFNFRQIEAANRALGPIFFLAYVFFVFFVLLNMFLAIINDTYSEVKAEIQGQRNEFEIADYFKQWGNSIKGKMGRRNTRLDAEASIKLASADGEISYNELRENLSRSGFNEVEIELFLARFDLDQYRTLNEDETQQILQDLEGETILLEGETHYHNAVPDAHVQEQQRKSIMPQPTEDRSGLQDRVQLIENSLSDFIHITSRIMERINARGGQPTQEFESEVPKNVPDRKSVLLS